VKMYHFRPCAFFLLPNFFFYLSPWKEGFTIQTFFEFACGLVRLRLPWSEEMRVLVDTRRLSPVAQRFKSFFFFLCLRISPPFLRLLAEERSNLPPVAVWTLLLGSPLF